MIFWAKTTEDGKNLDCTIEKSLGVWEATCIYSVVRNWRDPTLHSVSCKEAAYKSVRRSCRFVKRESEEPILPNILQTTKLQIGKGLYFIHVFQRR